MGQLWSSSPTTSSRGHCSRPTCSETQQRFRLFHLLQNVSWCITVRSFIFGSLTLYSELQKHIYPHILCCRYQQRLNTYTKMYMVVQSKTNVNTQVIIHNANKRIYINWRDFLFTKRALKSKNPVKNLKYKLSQESAGTHVHFEWGVCWDGQHYISKDRLVILIKVNLVNVSDLEEKEKDSMFVLRVAPEIDHRVITIKMKAASFRNPACAASNRHRH